jgi:hypothetical protein
MSQDVEKPRQSAPYVVIFNSGENEISFLARAFFIHSSKNSIDISVSPEVYGGQRVIVPADACEAMEPRDGGFTPGEKILMRFEAAMERRSKRVDLRFCTGAPHLRNPLFDNLRPDYGKA